MGDYEDVIQRLRDAGEDDDADILEKYTKGQLREKAGRASSLEKENEELKAEVAVLKSGPKREEALRAAKVDVDNLSKAERAIIESTKPEDGEYTEDWARGLVQQFELPVSETTEDGEGGKPPAAGIVDQATKAPSGGGKLSTAITPEEANEWDRDKRRRFLEEHPQDYDRLLQGETVNVAFS